MPKQKKVDKLIKIDEQFVKKTKNFISSVKYMIPFNIKCIKCQNIINKGKKITAIKENVPNHNYLGINFLRFYFKCLYCSKGMSIKSNPKNFSYLLEIN